MSPGFATSSPAKSWSSSHNTPPGGSASGPASKAADGRLFRAGPQDRRGAPRLG